MAGSGSHGAEIKVLAGACPTGGSTREGFVPTSPLVVVDRTCILVTMGLSPHRLANSWPALSSWTLPSGPHHMASSVGPLTH